MRPDEPKLPNGETGEYSENLQIAIFAVGG